MTGIAVIIPALERNAYHDQGDLAPFGDVSLLEWKLSQVRKVVPERQVYISSPSAAIWDFGEERGVNIIRRDIALDLSDMICQSIAGVSEEVVLWANVTSPFVSSKDYLSFIDAFKKMGSSHDSLLTAWPLKEYVFFGGKPLNFELHRHISRRTIEPAYVFTNGCFVIRKELAVSLRSYIGTRPLLYEVDKLTALEIKDLADLNVANDLLTLYMKAKEL